MNDPIDRQAAIDALKTDMASLDHIIKGMSAYDVRLDAYVSQRNQVDCDIDTISNLPPAQPEQQWIPCSERLPEIDKEVLVTNGESCWVCSLFESPDIEDGLYQWEDNYGHWHEFETWVAWMSLPELYKGE